MVDFFVRAISCFEQIGALAKQYRNQNRERFMKWSWIFIVTILINGILLNSRSYEYLNFIKLAIMYVTAIICSVLLIVMFIGKAVDSVRYSLILLLLILVGTIGISISIARYFSLIYALYHCVVFTIAFTVLWGVFSLIIQTDIAQIINSNITMFATIITIVVNIAMVIKHSPTAYGLAFNYCVLPFVVGCGISSALVDLKLHCIKKYIENNQVNNADQQTSSTE